MKVIYGLGRLKNKFKATVAALGVFDGFHLGHRRLVKAAVKTAMRLRLKSLVITFWPHPENIIHPGNRLAHLISLEHRLEFFASLGVDYCLVIRFTKQFARMRSEDFIQRVLFARMRPRVVFVGRNFRFGRNARGNTLLLNAYARALNYRLRVAPDVKSGAKLVSSSLIRRLIQQGRLREAARFLGRPVSVLGTVIKGDSRGRRLGFPTANINAHHEVTPSSGVYIVKVILGRRKSFGLCYIGSRPTFKDKAEALRIEVHIFNFNRNIYGRDIHIEFIKKIREEERFTSHFELSRRIEKDISYARSFLKHPRL